MKFMVIGCGRMGAELALVLSRHGHTITLVDKDRGAMEQLAQSFLARTIVGTCFDQGVLLHALESLVDELAACF